MPGSNSASGFPHGVLFIVIVAALVCVCGPSAALGAELEVQVTGVSATQAILRYRSPTNRPCSVEVSESNTFRPLVHDVDPDLVRRRIGHALGAAEPADRRASS